MSKMPKLRFKEFSGEWDVKNLEELTNYVDYRGKTPTKSESGIFLVTAKNIKKGYIDYAASQEFISKESYDEAMRRGLPKKGDVLLTTEAPLGNVAQIDREDVALAQRVIKFRGTDELNNTYLKYYFLSQRFQNKLFSKAIGTTVLGIQGKVLHKMSVTFPSKEEQEKIAYFFSLIDDKISLQGEKVEALKDYKKGVMQKIFTRELRFKDGEGKYYPKWEEKELNKLGDTYTGLSGKTKENFGIGEAKYVIYKNVFGNTLAKEEQVELVEINKGEKQNKVIKGDLLFTTSSETPEEVGMISCWNYDTEDLYLNSFCFGYRLFDLEQCSPIFMAYLLRSEVYRKKISILAQGSTRYNISKNELMKMKVSIPIIDEQRKIESLLLCLESKIEREREKLNSLNEYKKGLLQQMFV